MPITINVPTEYLQSPDDSCINSLIDLINYVQPTMPNPSIRFMVFEVTSDRFYEAIKAAHSRGVDVGGLICYRQSMGPTQNEKLHALWKDVPRSNFTLVMSEVGGVIMHKKSLWIGWNENSKVLVPEQYTDWRDAAQKGIPVTASGSFNYTDSAQKQNNSLSFVPGQAYAAFNQESYNKNKAFNVAKHPAWQVDSIPVLPTLREL